MDVVLGRDRDVEVDDVAELLDVDAAGCDVGGDEDPVLAALEAGECGGPLRLRVPRQLGYKSVKFVNRLMVTDSLKGFVSTYDRKSPNYGYSWYAGI